MTITTPAEFKSPARQDYATAEDAMADEWLTLIHGAHYLWSVQVSHMDGHAFDPPWDVTSTDYIQAPYQNDARSLADLEMTSRLRRPDENGEVWYRLVAHLEHAELRATLYRCNSDDTTDGIAEHNVSETNGDPTWRAIEGSVSDADARDFENGGNAYVPLFWELEGRVDADGNTGKLRHVDGWEAIATPRATIPHT